MITLSIMMANIMQGVDNSILNVALPHIQGSLSASQDQAAWALTSYIVCAAIMMPLTGWLAGRFGIKYIFLVSVIGFTLASALCGAATSLGELVLFRALQGVAGAGLAPLSQATLLQINPPERHGRAMAVFSTGTILGPIMGLALGVFHQPAGRHAVHPGQPDIYSPDPLRASGTVRFHRVPDPEPGDRRPAIDARPGRAEGLVPFERNLDRGDGRRARLLPVYRAHGNHRRALVSQPRFIEERQFRRRHRAGVLCRADPVRRPGAAADDAAKPDELSGGNRRAGGCCARHRGHGSAVPRRPADQPCRQPPDHSVRPAADRGVDVADELLLVADEHGAGSHLRAAAGFRPRLHPSAAEHHRAIDAAAPHHDPGDGSPPADAQPWRQHRHQHSGRNLGPEYSGGSLAPGRRPATGQSAGPGALPASAVQPEHAGRDGGTQYRSDAAGCNGRLYR